MNQATDDFDVSTLQDKSNYQIDGLDSEIHADRLCSALLKKFHQHLLHEQKLEMLEAGSQAAGADYFLREFMIGYRRDNIYHGCADLVRQFAGHWYITSNLEPNMTELIAILDGTASFFSYCAEHKLVTTDTSDKITETCQQIDFFQQRIEDFHDISGDGYGNWKKICPLD